MKDLKPTRGLRRLLALIAEGEHVSQDFKYLISDARKIARSISAFSNNQGGRLLIGVKDNGTIAGVRSEEDIFMIEQAADLYCSPRVAVDFEAVRAGGSAVVFIATVAQAPRRPIAVREDDGTLVSYYRVNDENLVAHPLMVRAWRRSARAEGTLLALSDADGDLLRLVADNPGIAPEQLAPLAHMSRRVTDDALARLLAMNLLAFNHDGHRFTLVIPPENC